MEDRGAFFNAKIYYGGNKIKNQTYTEFVEKFKPKKTTDDCYTPPEVYEAVLDFVIEEYGIDKSKVVRPFYPGGDFENFDYSDGQVVVDNPPFSILTKIVDFYTERQIKFFIFAPTLTLFSGRQNVTYIATGVTVRYENKAKVNTSFITNLDNALIRTAPKLYKAIELANTKPTKTLPKYEYPDNLLTASMLPVLNQADIDFSLTTDDACCFIRALDAQRALGKTIFGGGYLIADEKAKELKSKKAKSKKAPITLKLSDREKELIRDHAKNNRE